jgi:hypothetical protein
VELVVHPPEPRPGDLRVDLRGRDVGVPQHHLERPQVRAVLQQVRREGVPQGVRGQRRRDSRARGRSPRLAARRAAASSPPARTERKCSRGPLVEPGRADSVPPSHARGCRKAPGAACRPCRWTRARWLRDPASVGRPTISETRRPEAHIAGWLAVAQAGGVDVSGRRDLPSASASRSPTLGFAVRGRILGEPEVRRGERRNAHRRRAPAERRRPAAQARGSGRDRSVRGARLEPALAQEAAEGGPER